MRASRTWFLMGWLAVLAVSLSVLNFNNQLVPPSLYLIQYKRWGLELLNGLPYSATYPLWGYPIVIAAIGEISREGMDVLLLVLQVAMCFGLIMVWSRVWCTQWSKRIFVLWSILLIPVFSFASLRAPDAWVMLAFMLVLFCLSQWASSHRRQWLVVAFVTAVVGVNMRSEWLGFFALFLGIMLVPTFFLRSELVRPLLIFLAVIVSGSLVGITPWGMNAYRLTSSLVLTSTNTGMTFYEGFAQGPENPWQRKDSDSEPARYVGGIGISSTVSLQGNNALIAASLDDVRLYPIAYLKKVVWVFSRALTGGIYTMYDWWSDQLLERATKLQRVQLAVAGDPLAIAWAIGSALSWVYRIAYLLLSVTVFWLSARAIKGRLVRIENRLVILFVTAYLLYTLSVVSLIRYESRYLSATFPLLVLAVTQTITSESLKALAGNTVYGLLTSVMRNFGNLKLYIGGKRE